MDLDYIKNKTKQITNIFGICGDDEKYIETWIKYPYRPARRHAP